MKWYMLGISYQYFSKEKGEIRNDSCKTYGNGRDMCGWCCCMDSFVGGGHESSWKGDTSGQYHVDCFRLFFDGRIFCTYASSRLLRVGCRLRKELILHENHQRNALGLLFRVHSRSNSRLICDCISE